MKFDMNFKYVFGFLLLISLLSQACAWEWQNALALTEALQNFIKDETRHPFLGMDVANMNPEEKMDICTDAATRLDLALLPHNPMQPSGTSDLVVGITVYWNRFEKRTFSVFSCGKNDKKTYFFGKGPRPNTIAVYMLPKGDNFGGIVGIMDYSLQPQQSQPRAWKWYDSGVLFSVIKYFIGNEENYPFLGKDVTKMNEEEKIKICTDAAPFVMTPQTVVKLNDDLEVKLFLNGKSLKFSAFSCGKNEKLTYLFSKGPSENTIAAYVLYKGNTIGIEHGIMDYSWQPPALVWKWQDVYELNEALQKNLTFSGKDVTEMSNAEKMEICTNAITLLMLPQIVMELSDVTNLAVAINVNGINKEQTFPVFSCGKNEKIRYFLGKGPTKNTITMYTRMENSALGAPLGIIDSLAWKWQNVLELNETLQNYHPFLGKDVTEMSNAEKMKICTNAVTFAMLSQFVVELSDVTNLAVGIIVDGINKEQTFSVFSCGKIEGRRYFFGKGPRENTIAVYTKMENSDLGVPLGIIDYSSQPP